MPDDAVVRYTLTLETKNKEGTDYDVLATCSMDLHTSIKNINPNPIELELSDEAPLIGFLSPRQSHTFFCGLRNKDERREDDINYKMYFESVESDNEAKEPTQE